MIVKLHPPPLSPPPPPLRIPSGEKMPLLNFCFFVFEKKIVCKKKVLSKFVDRDNEEDKLRDDDDDTFDVKGCKIISMF